MTTPARLGAAALMNAGIHRRTAFRIVAQDRIPERGKNRAIVLRLLEEAAAAATDASDDATGDDWHNVKREEDARLTREKRIASERQNAVEAGALVSRAEVRAAHARAGQALRAGIESAVRVVGALCPDDLRPAVVRELEAEYARMRAAVASALEGAA